MRKLALLFPGQGSQYVGMGMTLYNEFETVRHVYEEAGEVLGKDIRRICFEGNLSELNKLENMFPAIVVTGIAAFKAYMEEIGIQPDYMAGHSLGEYTALACSGIISFSDALRLTTERAILAMDSYYTENGTMTVINQLSRLAVEEECKRISTPGNIVVTSCHNSPDQTVVSGHHSAVMELEDCVIRKGAQITPMLMSPPFHSPLMEKASLALKDRLKACVFNKSKWPVISNFTGRPYESEDESITKWLIMQMVKPVQWQLTMQYLEDEGVTHVIGMDSQAIMANLAKANMKDCKVITYGQSNDRQELITSVNLLKAKKSQVTLLTKCLAAATSTRNRNWDDMEYSMGVERPYEKIESMQDKLDNSRGVPSVEQMREALNMLRSIFNTKKVPETEQFKWFEKILTETETKDIFKEFLQPFKGR